MIKIQDINEESGSVHESEELHPLKNPKNDNETLTTNLEEPTNPKESCAIMVNGSIILDQPRKFNPNSHDNLQHDSLAIAAEV